MFQGWKQCLGLALGPSVTSVQPSRGTAALLSSPSSKDSKSGSAPPLTPHPPCSIRGEWAWQMAEMFALIPSWGAPMRSANPFLCWRIEALDLIKEKLQVFSQCRRACEQAGKITHASWLPDFCWRWPHLCSGLWNGQGSYHQDVFPFLLMPFPPAHPAPLVPPVTQLQVLGLAGSLVVTIPVPCLITVWFSMVCYPSAFFPWYLSPTSLLTPTSSLEPPEAGAEAAPALLRACGSTGGRHRLCLLGTVLWGPGNWQGTHCALCWHNPLKIHLPSWQVSAKLHDLRLFENTFITWLHLLALGQLTPILPNFKLLLK